MHFYKTVKCCQGGTKDMSISMIGIDYNKANVDIRAMFSFNPCHVFIYKEKCDSGHGTTEENTGDPGMCDPVYL